MNYSVIAMQSILPGCEFSWGEPYNYEEINWVDSRPCPTKEAWEAEKARLIAYQPIADRKATAKVLLTESDWSETPSSIQLLENASEWTDYRIALKKILIDPQNNTEFPKKPEVRWKA